MVEIKVDLSLDLNRFNNFSNQYDLGIKVSVNNTVTRLGTSVYLHIWDGNKQNNLIISTPYIPSHLVGLADPGH